MDPQRSLTCFTGNVFYLVPHFKGPSFSMLTGARLCVCLLVFGYCCIVFQKKGKEYPLFKVCIDLLHVEKI